MVTDSIKLMNEYLFKKYNEDMSIDWFDNQGVIKLNKKDFIAVITLDSDISNYFYLYTVDIISTETGLIHSKRFNFDDYFYYNINIHKENKNRYVLYPKNFDIDFDILIERIFDYINHFN